MSADRAARKIVDGVLAGKPLVTLTPLAKIGTRVHGLAPATTIRVMGLATRLLPSAPTPGRADASATRTVTGAQARATLPRPARAVVGALTVLGSRAARRNNERGHDAPR